MIARLPIALRLLVRLVPPAERAETALDLAAEFRSRANGTGWLRAHLWAWAQLVRSVRPLSRRSWVRGMTGFDSIANRMNPGGIAFERWILETRYAFRRCITRPGFTILAVLTLAVGVGGIAALVGIARPLFISPLPYPHPDQLAVFWRPGDWRGREIALLRNQWRSDGFAAVAAYRPSDVTLERDGAPTRVVPGIASTTELFSVLGVQPALGRAFNAGEDVPGSASSVVLSDRVWRELGGDRALVGKSILLNGVKRTVIGVMPSGFWFPDPSIGVWLADELPPDGQVGSYTLVGRVAPGRRVEQMQLGLQRITSLLASHFTYSPQWDITKNPVLTPLATALVGGLRPAIFATLAGVAAILLIAVANVAALVLGHIERRATELSVRVALGADRKRIAAQITIEMALIGVAAAVVGALVGTAGFGILREWLPLGAWRDAGGPGWTPFIAAFVIAMTAALAIALFPVLSLGRRDLQPLLAGSRTSGVVRPSLMQPALIVSEVALAVLLACGAGLLARTVANRYAVNPGLDINHVAVLDIALPNATNAKRLAELNAIVDAVGAIPGVRAAAATQALPLRGGGWTMGLRLPDVPNDAPTPHFRLVTRDYFTTLGIPLLRGRGFASTDAATDSVASVVINARLASLYFPHVDPVGQVMLGGFGRPERIVGVVGDVAEDSLSGTRPPTRYYLVDQAFVADGQSIALRVAPAMDPASVLPAARHAVQAVAPAAALREATTMRRVLDRAIGPARDVMSLLSLLTALALVLAAIGIYGVISQFVTQRDREWGIRLALGLAPSRVIAQIVRRGLALVVIGVAIGGIASLLLTRLLASFLYGVSPRDPLALAAAAAALVAVGAGAALVPALRAGRTDPAVVLREQ